MSKPDFMGIGAQRCGTTSMYHYLSRHPDIAKPARKETFYFAYNYDKSEEWYRNIFPDSGKSFEICTYYLYHPLAPQRIKNEWDGNKFFVMLRNPVDRAYSQFWHEKRVGHEDAIITFDDAVNLEEARLRGSDPRRGRAIGYESFGYLKRSIYVEQLERWFRYFDREKIEIIKSERFYQNTSKVVKELLEFLDIAPLDLGPYEKYYGLDYPEMSDKMRERLKEYYEPYNEKLYDLIGRRLW